MLLFITVLKYCQETGQGQWVSREGSRKGLCVQVVKLISIHPILL
jgi:hypothetical protein